MSFMAHNGTALRDGNKACVSLHPTPSASTLPADVVFSTVTRFIAGSFRTSTLIRYILRGYFNINEGTPVNKSFPD